MSYRDAENAICFGELKQAAIYFDRVLPIAFRCLRTPPGGTVLDVPEEVPLGVFSQLIYGKDAPDWLVIPYLDASFMPFFVNIAERFSRRMVSTDPDFYKEARMLYLQNHSTPESGSIRTEFARFANELGFSYSSMLLPGDDPRQASISDVYTTITMSKVPLVDVSSASWEQIMELRRDPEAKKKLRRLRLFLYENYVGKETAFIEDDLQRRLDDYDSAMRSLGLRAATSVLSVILDAKNLQSSIAAGIAGALWGGTAGAITSAAVIELGKIAIEIAKKRQDVHELQQGHDLAFIIAAEEKLG